MNHMDASLWPKKETVIFNVNNYSWSFSTDVFSAITHFLFNMALPLSSHM